MNEFLNALNFRHACKIFDEKKEIPSHIFEDILESGRMSPSSFGMEPTRFIVVRNKKLREELRELCWKQVQITSCSELVILKSLIQPLMPPSNYVKNLSVRRGKTKEEREKWMNFYGRFLRERENLGQSVEMWAHKQAYIAASSMMNCAAFLGVDSCAIEGFDIKKVNELLGLDRFSESVALILPFGYRIKPQQARYRLNLDEIVEYR